MPQEILIQEVCENCHCAGVAVVGFTRITKVNPRHNLPGLILLSAIILGMVFLYGWFKLTDIMAAYYSFATPKYLEVVGFAGAVVGMRLVMWKLPLRVLMCPECRKVKAFGFGKALPLDWQKSIKPEWTCSQCGYSLIGVCEQPRCPECAHPFPKEWLKATALADPEIEVEIKVVNWIEMWRAENQDAELWRHTRTRDKRT